ncbi:copper amine oxidase [Xylariaceae sp. FL0804]|nr:copper amine oxidase [Xylariaceae sp. FL0804]
MAAAHHEPSSSGPPLLPPPPHPLRPLSASELRRARDVVVAAAHRADAGERLVFRSIYAAEPTRAELTRYLAREHKHDAAAAAGGPAGGGSGGVQEAEEEEAEAEWEAPARLITVLYDVISGAGDDHRLVRLVETTVELLGGDDGNGGGKVNGDGTGEDKGKGKGTGGGRVRSSKTFPPHSQTSFTAEEFGQLQDACEASPLFRQAVAELDLPAGFVVTIDPWPYGGPDPEDEGAPRYMQGLVFARDTSKGNNNPDANHYAYPLPIIPVMDFYSRRLVRVDRLPTGGRGDGIRPPPPLLPDDGGGEGEQQQQQNQQQNQQKRPKTKLFAHHKTAEYVPELLDAPPRPGLRPIRVLQPSGASFAVTAAEHVVTWQGWRFRVGFTPREGAVLHDVRHSGRPVLLRLSFSEMTVPYADPRPPFHRKQAFDFGDGGVGRAANDLALGCDCLGAVAYLDAVVADARGEPEWARNVVCIHEQDNGIGWKHTNFRTGRAVVTRLRELVVQFVVTLANYEYVFAYKLDTAGGITVETRATGIVSVVAIDEGKTSAYGNVVSPGVLAQNHQHIFALRIDPSIDSYAADSTAVVLEESRPLPMSPSTNPYGNGYEVVRLPVSRAATADAEPTLGRSVRLESTSNTNPVSGRAAAYRFTPPATPLLLADARSAQARRAPFARHHLWVTGHRDGELWAAGEFTNQSRGEEGGVRAMVARGDWFADGEEREEGGGGGEGEGEGEGKGRRSSPVVWSVFGLTHNPRVEDWPVMPVEIHQLHIRPDDFFTSNPALDMPSGKDQSSVLVPCCGNGNSNDSEAEKKEKKASVVDKARPDGAADAAAHLQGPSRDLDPKTLGTEPKTKEKRRLSSTLSGLFAWKKD